VVVPEVAQEPPEPLRAAERAVGDDEDAGLDPGASGRGRERLRVGQRVAPAGPGRPGEVALDVEERGAGHVPGEVPLPAPGRVVEGPAAVDEPVAHAATLSRRRQALAGAVRCGYPAGTRGPASVRAEAMEPHDSGSRGA